MDGIQKTVWLALKEMMVRVEEGQYGENDDFGSSGFMCDLEDVVVCVTE